MPELARRAFFWVVVGFGGNTRYSILKLPNDSELAPWTWQPRKKKRIAKTYLKRFVSIEISNGVSTRTRIDGAK